MLLSILLNYFCGLEMAEREARGLGNRRLFVFAAAVNLGLLGFFKYAGFLAESLNAFLPFDLPVPGLNLPVGISFTRFRFYPISSMCIRKKYGRRKILFLLDYM